MYRKFSKLSRTLRLERTVAVIC